VGRHVVRTLGGMAEDRVPFGNEASEEPLEVALDLRVGVLLDDERRRRVADMEGQEARPDSGRSRPRFDLVGDLDEARAACRDVELPHLLLHRHGAQCRRRGAPAQPPGA